MGIAKNDAANSPVYVIIQFKYTNLPRIKCMAMAKDKGPKKESGKKTAVKSLKEKRADKKQKQAEKRRKD